MQTIQTYWTDNGRIDFFADYETEAQAISGFAEYLAEYDYTIDNFGGAVLFENGVAVRVLDIAQEIEIALQDTLDNWAANEAHIASERSAYYENQL